MKKTVSLIVSVSIMFFLNLAGCAELQKPGAAFDHDIHKLAEQGEAISQSKIGESNKSEGVQQDYTKVTKWWHMAAEQGDAYSQRVLGEMYYYADGVPQDFVRAYVWMSFAAAQDTDYSEMRDTVLKSMTPQQVALARELSIEIQNKIEQKTKEEI